nr:uncharacterized protein LOC109174175 [Ipomoea batatas]
MHGSLQQHPSNMIAHRMEHKLVRRSRVSVSLDMLVFEIYEVIECLRRYNDPAGAISVDTLCSLTRKDQWCKGVQSSEFVDWIHSEGLIDLGFSRPKLTWVEGNSSGNAKGARLDRALCNFDWRQRFHEATISHCPRISSDHTPILIRTTVRDVNRGCNHFRFHAALLTDDRLGAVIRIEWRKNHSFVTTFLGCQKR